MLSGFCSNNIKIDGTPILDMIAYNGVKWTRYDVDGPNAGRTISGLMVRDRVATKIRLDITCRPLKRDQLNTLLNLLLPEFVQVTYEDPMYGLVTKTMYANNNPAQFLILRESGQEYWNNITFPLVER